MHTPHPEVPGAQHSLQHPRHLHGSGPTDLLGRQEDVYPCTACQNQAGWVFKGLVLLLEANPKSAAGGGGFEEMPLKSLIQNFRLVIESYQDHRGNSTFDKTINRY